MEGFEHSKRLHQGPLPELCLSLRNFLHLFGQPVRLIWLRCSKRDMFKKEMQHCHSDLKTIALLNLPTVQVKTCDKVETRDKSAEAAPLQNDWKQRLRRSGCCVVAAETFFQLN